MQHTDIRTTMRVYNHVDAGRVKREVYKFENSHSNLHSFKKLCRLMKGYVKVDYKGWLKIRLV